MAKHSFFTRCPPSHFTEMTWQRNNTCLNKFSKDACVMSQKLRTDAWNTLKVAEDYTRNVMNKNTSKLETRAKNVAFWRDEVIKELNLMDTETETLLEQKRILEKALYDSKQVLRVAEENVLQRLKRKGVEQVADEPERAICKEVELIRRCQRRMDDMASRADIQARLNRCARHALDIDARDKLHTKLLDERMANLSTCSFGIGYHPGVETVDNTISTTASHAYYTQELMKRSQVERASSRRLRDDLDLLLRQSAYAMADQFNYTNLVLEKRLQELKAALKRDESNLAKANIEIRDLERALAMIRNAIAEKEMVMKLAQSRLQMRNHRICIENSADAPNSGLREEVYRLRQTLATLREKQRAMEKMLARLIESRNNLQLDISTKMDAVQIDERCVMATRKDIPIDPKVGPFFLLQNQSSAGSKHHGTECGQPEVRTGAGCCLPAVPTFTGVACCI